MTQSKTSKCLVVFACGFVALAALSASAAHQNQDQGKQDLSGIWVMQGGEAKIEFAKKQVLKIYPHGDEEVITLLCQYSVDKKGVVKAKLTGLDGKAEFKEHAKEKLPVGLEFGFSWTVKGETATLANVTGKEAGLFKARLEGKYEQKK